MDSKTLIEKTVKSDALGKTSATRVKDVIIRGFIPRFLSPDSSPAQWLKIIKTSTIDSRRFKQLLFLYACRAHALLRDIVIDIYWPHVFSGSSSIHKDEIRRHILQSAGTTKMPKRWSESQIARVTRGVGRCLTDFELTRKIHNGIREISPYRIFPFTVLFICFEAHTRGIDDNAIIHLTEWKLFGMQQEDIVSELRGIGSSEDYFIFQFAGDLARFTWQYDTMEEFLHAYVG